MKIHYYNDRTIRVTSHVRIPNKVSALLLGRFKEYPRTSGTNPITGNYYIECRVTPFLTVRVEETSPEGDEFISSAIYDFFIPHTIKDGENY